jgi:hypothetical protein
MAIGEKFEPLSPDWPWIIFGDGYEAQVAGIMPSKDSHGKDVFKLTLVPTRELAKRYEIGMDLLDENLSLIREYPIDKIVLLNNDPAWTRYFCYLNFNGQPVPNTMTMASYQESEKIAGLRAMIDLIKSENAFLREMLEKAKTNVSQFIKEYVMAPASEMNIASIMQSQQNQTTNFQPASPVRNV